MAEIQTSTDPMAKHFFAKLQQETVAPIQEEEIQEEIKEEIKEEVVEELQQTNETPPVVEEQQVIAETQEEVKPVFVPEFKNEASRILYEKLLNEDDKSVFELLRNKYEGDLLSDEEKAVKYLQNKYPHLDEKDIQFKVASEYGIGTTELSEEEYNDLDEAQKREIRKQAIERKTLIAEATRFFDERKQQFELPKLPNPVELDEDYKAYKEAIAKAQEQQEADDARLKGIIEEIETTSKSVNTLVIEAKFDLDDREFTYKSDFKLDAKKQNELVEYAKVYTPTQDEIARFTNNGKFDMGGYLSHLAEIKFSKQIRDMAIKDAIQRDRENFVSKELHNSTLRNNDVSVTAHPQKSWTASMMSK